MTQVEAEQSAKPLPRDPAKIFPVSWDQFHRDLRALAWRLSGAGPFEAIVCITRGGLVPAAIVARELGIKLIETICVSSYSGTSQGELIVLKSVAQSDYRARRRRGRARSSGRRPGRYRQDRESGARDRAARPPRHGLRQAHGPPAGRYLHHRSVAGYVDLFPLGHRISVPAADQRGRLIEGGCRWMP